MDPALKLSLEEMPDAADVRFVNERLREYNLLHAEDDNHCPLAVLLRGDGDAIVGGLLGATFWGWLHIDVLWIKDGLRNAGYGQTLLRQAEEEAIRRGCRHASVETHSFQALSFYERRGYAIFGQLDDFPQGHTKYYLNKRLQRPSNGGEAV